MNAWTELMPGVYTGYRIPGASRPAWFPRRILQRQGVRRPARRWHVCRRLPY